MRGLRRDDLGAPVPRGSPPEEALEELRSCAGTQFDADVVRALVAVCASQHVEVAALA